tara:strand:- start:58 stop:645 length:588 start_codon:yes stop_codon:yes gene_type:complete
MKWIGQQIYDQVSRFKNDVFFENPVSLTSSLTVDSALTVGGTTVFTSPALARPAVEIKNTGGNAEGGNLSFKLDKGVVGADEDIPGIINWINDNDAQQQITFGQLYTMVADATDGQEAGTMYLKVAEFDGTLTAGLTLNGDTNANGEVDVSIGSGAGSTTTIASGVIMMSNLPTSDPSNAGQLWNSGGYIKVSAG